MSRDRGRDRGVEARGRGEALEGLEAASRPRRRDRGHIPSTSTTEIFVNSELMPLLCGR